MEKIFLYKSFRLEKFLSDFIYLDLDERRSFEERKCVHKKSRQIFYETLPGEVTWLVAISEDLYLRTV